MFNLRQKFSDGITSLKNSMVNDRSATSSNKFNSSIISVDELDAISKQGIGQRILNLKIGGVFKNGFIFENEANRAIWDRLKIKDELIKAGKDMLTFGGAYVIIIEKDKELSEPISKKVNLNNVLVKSFTKDMVVPSVVSFDLYDDRFMKPKGYYVYGKEVHISRVIEFNYIEPLDLKKSSYSFSGISEFEIIYTQLIDDAVITRAIPSVISKGSITHYKVDGFKEALASGKEDAILRFYSAMENMKDISGSVILDKNDDIIENTKTLSNLDVADKTTLRRIAMSVGIPLKILMGENMQSQGLHSDNLQDVVYINTLMELKDSYLASNVTKIGEMLGLGNIEFANFETFTKDDESKIIDNATKLDVLGSDGEEYLRDNGFEKYVQESDEDEIEEIVVEEVI